MKKGMYDAALITSPIIETGDKKSGGQVLGISLGWDFASEHEWGIDRIYRVFAIPGRPQRGLIGADVRTVTKVPETLKFFQFDNAAYLFLYETFLWTKESDWNEKELDRILRADENEELSTAWDEAAFAVRIKNDALDSGTIVLGQFHEAFIKKDVMIFFGGKTTPLGNKGLILAIRSRMPKDVLHGMKERDEDYLNLQDAFADTGIAQKLKNAEKRYYALTPTWSDEKKESLIFRLNPEDQEDNNFGWFTLKDLEDWILGKGPILNKK